MRRSVSFFIAVTVALALPMAGFGQNPADVPDEIRQFYQQRNVAAAFSTPAERSALAAVEDADSLSERLRVVHGLLSSLEGKELDPDPQMILPQAQQTSIIPTALAEVLAATAEGEDVLRVDVRVRHLDRAENFQYIQTYEDGKIVLPVHPFAYSPVSAREVHTWRRIGGRWLREAAGMVFLSE